VGFKIDVKGLDDIQKALKDLEKSVDPNTFNEWADRVGRTAKQTCNDPQGERIKLTRTGQGGVEFEFADKDAIDCVINAIKRHLPSMPDIQKRIFEGMLKDFESRKSKL